MTAGGWDWARIVWGASLLLAPGRVCELLTATPLDRRAALVTRALGARTLAQALLVCARRSRRTMVTAAAVDAAHAATMLPLALRSRAYARPAAVSGTIAAASAAEAAARLSAA